MGLRDYVKCFTRNRITMTGLAALVAGFGLTISGLYHRNAGHIIAAGTSSGIGISLLSATVFGRATYRSYNEMRDLIGQHGGIKDSLIDAYVRAPYCKKTGMRLAAKESGLEQVLDQGFIERAPEGKKRMLYYFFGNMFDRWL